MQILADDLIKLLFGLPSEVSIGCRLVLIELFALSIRDFWRGFESALFTRHSDPGVSCVFGNWHHQIAIFIGAPRIVKSVVEINDSDYAVHPTQDVLIIPCSRRDS